MKEEFEDTNVVIRIRISKNRQHNAQKKKVQKDKQRSTKEKKRKFKQSTIPSISIKRTITSRLKAVNIKNTTTDDVEILVLVWDRHNIVAGLNRLMCF